MQIISMLLAIPVTVILVLWIKNLKKDNPFPKGSIVRALVLGGIAMVLASVCGYVVAITTAISLVRLRHAGNGKRGR